MGKPSIGAAVLLFTLAAVPTAARPMLQRGTQELAVHVSPDFEGAIGDMLDARAGFGWFVRDGLSLRATVAPRAGVKYFLADNVALDFEVTYELSPSDVFINDFVAEDTDLSSQIGLRVLF